MYLRLIISLLDNVPHYSILRIDNVANNSDVFLPLLSNSLLLFKAHNLFFKPQNTQLSAHTKLLVYLLGRTQPEPAGKAIPLRSKQVYLAYHTACMDF